MKRLDVGDVVGSSVSLVARNLGTYLRTMGVPILVVSLVSLTASVFVLRASLEALSGLVARPFDPAQLAPLVPLAAWFVFAGLAGMFIQVATYAIGFVATREIMEGRKPTLAQTWALARGRYASLLGTGIVMVAAFLGVGLVLGSIALFIIFAAPMLAPLIAILILLGIGTILYLVLRWTVAGAVAVFEDRTVTGNLARSAQLTNGLAVQVFLVLLLVFLIALVVSAVASFPTSFLAGTGFGAPSADPVAAFLATLEPRMQIANGLTNLVSTLLLDFLAVAISTTLYRRLSAPPADEATPAPSEPPAAPPAEPGPQ